MTSAMKPGAALAWLAGRLIDPFGRRRYRPANARLMAAPKTGRRAVFIGDSLIEGWRGLKALAPPGWTFINRGISGQTAAQVRGRFGPDALALAPDVVVVLAGTNDLRALAGSPAAHGRRATPALIATLADLDDRARAAGVTLAFCALPPVSDAVAGARAGASRRDPDAPRAANRGIAALAAARGRVFLDFHAALVDGAGRFAAGLTRDGVHPNAEGYDRMAVVLMAALAAGLDCFER